MPCDLGADAVWFAIEGVYKALTLRAIVQTQGHNIRTYSEYLLRRAIEYGATKVDYVRGGEGRLKRLTVEKGLLREAESVQDQIRSLLKCQVCEATCNNISCWFDSV